MQRFSETAHAQEREEEKGDRERGLSVAARVIIGNIVSCSLAADPCTQQR